MLELYRTLAEAYGRVGGWAKAALVIGFFVGSTTIAFGIIVWLPPDHFKRTGRESWWYQRRLLRWPVVVLKNALGVAVLPLGFFMILGPGPGLVVCAIALSLIDFPGRRALVRRLVGKPSVLRSLNDLRALFGKAPLVLE